METSKKLTRTVLRLTCEASLGSSLTQQQEKKCHKAASAPCHEQRVFALQFMVPGSSISFGSLAI